MSSDDDLISPHLEKHSNDIYREILEDSFKYLPEDEKNVGPSENDEKNADGRLTDRQRAHVTYRHFTGNQRGSGVNDGIHYFCRGGEIGAIGSEDCYCQR